LMLTVLFTLSLAALIVLSGAASKAEAQSAAPDLSATNSVLQDLEDDGKLNSDKSEELEKWNRPENSSGAATSTATASPSASAARSQYDEPVPDPEPSGNSSALPLMLGSGALLVGGGLLARRLFR
jgi:hypothetical protein